MVSPSLLDLDYGSSIRIKSEIEAIGQAGIHLSLCAYRNGKPQENSKSHQIPFVPSIVKPGPNLHRLYLDPQLAMTAACVALRNRPHLIHAHLNEGSLVSALPRRAIQVPLIMDLQGSMVSELAFSGILGHHRLVYALFGLFEELSMHLVDHIIVSSPSLKRIVEGHVSSRNVTIVPDCVDVSLFSPRPKNLALMEELHIPADRFVVVYLGSLAKVQGIDLLLEASQKAIRENPQLHFLVMGFPFDEFYRSRATKLNVANNFTLPGRIPFALAPEYLSIGDIAISPKRNSSESNGKILNYMAMGLASVVFDNENNRFLAGDSAIYAKSQTADSLAEAILRAASDMQLRSHSADVGLARVKSAFSPSVMQERILSVYEQHW